MRSLLALLPLALLAADWPQFHGPNRDSKSDEKGVARTWPATGPEVLWKRDAGTGWSGPVVVGDRAILFHRVGDEEVVECVDAATGKEVWKKAYRTRYVDDFDFDSGPRATPLVADGRVFTLGADGTLSAFDLAKGELLWQKNLVAEYKPPKGFFGVATSPMIAGGNLLVNVGAKGAGVVAFEPATGKEVWKATDHAVSYSSPVVTKVDGEDLAVFFTRQGLLAITPDKGVVRYEYPWRPRINASVNAASPIVAGNQIFLSTSYGTGAVLLEAGKGELNEHWKNDDSMSCHFNTPVLVGEYLYGIHGRQEGGAELRCVEWKTGKVKWEKGRFGCASLVAVDGLLLALNEAGDLVLIEATPEGYKELARANVLGSKVRAAVALANGRAYGRDGNKWVCVKVK